MFIPIHMKYVVFTTRGLESEVESDLKENVGNVKILSQDYRRIVFDFSGNPNKLGTVRSVDDALIYSKQFNVNHLRKSLKTFADNTEKNDILQYLKVIQKIRKLSSKIVFSITLSNIGKKNYNPYEIKKEISIVL